MNLITIVCSCVIDVYLFHLFFSNYFDKRESVANDMFREKALQIISVLLLILCNFIGDGDLNILITPFVFYLYTMIMFSGKTGYKMLCFATAFCVLCGCEFLFMTFFRPDASAYKSSLVIVIQMIVIKFLSYVIILLINQTIGKRKRIENTKVFWMYMLIPVSSLMVMFITFYFIFSTELSFWVRLLFIFSYGFLFVGNIVSFYAFECYSGYLNQNLQQNLVIFKQEKDLEYYMQIAEIDKKQKELIHNISNQMKMISHFANQQDYKAVLKISGEINEEMRQDVKTIFCDNPVLNAILNEKKRDAEQHKIVAEFYVEPGIVLNISVTDMIALFGNLLDNAIRAASEAMREKYIKVFIYMQEIGGFFVVKIVNSFNEVVMDKGEFLSTKTDKGIHGVGIRSVNRIAEKYGGYLNCSVKDNEFESLLFLSTDKDE